jgi:hypothetical protein
MKRHAFDALSFVIGITFVAMAGAFSFSNLDLDVGALKWIAAGVLLALGTAMLITSKAGARVDEPEDSAPHLR